MSALTPEVSLFFGNNNWQELKMLISDSDVSKRLNNPNNLMNRLLSSNTSSRNGSKKSAAMSLFGVNNNNDKQVIRESKFVNPFKPKSDVDENENENKNINDNVNENENRAELAKKQQLDISNSLSEDLIEGGDNKIKLGLAHNTALDTLLESVQMMRIKLDDIKPDKLPSVISATSKVVESIRRERLEINKTDKNRNVHYHFYAPEQRKIEDYEVIEVTS